jgi:hypothetical protein
VIVEVENTVLIVGEVEFNRREVDVLAKIELDKLGFPFASDVSRVVDEVEFECMVLVPVKLELGKCELEEFENVVPGKLELDCGEEVDVGRVMGVLEFECIALLLIDLVLDETELEELVKIKLEVVELNFEEEVNVGRVVDEEEFVCITLLFRELEIDRRELEGLAKVKLEVLELNFEEEVDVNVLDEVEFANLVLLLDGIKLKLKSFELIVVVLDDEELLVVLVVLIVVLDNAVVVLLVVVLPELFFDEMKLGECELVELVNAGLELAIGEEDDVIGVVVDEDEFVSLAMLLVELRLLEVLIPAVELVFTEADRLVDALEEVFR